MFTHNVYFPESTYNTDQQVTTYTQPSLVSPVTATCPRSENQLARDLEDMMNDVTGEQGNTF